MSLKILDYDVFDKSSPFGETIGRPRNLAWPVNAYRITLPKPDKDAGLNMFERVILKIIDACGIWDAETLAQEICIPVDLVKFVLLRLKDKALIDENNKILNQGRDKWMVEKEPEFITALAFRELATGKILPFLHLLDDENPLRKKEMDKFYKIEKYDGYVNKKPDPHDIITALKAMKKHSGASGNYRRFPAIEQINIVNDPELFYLDCEIAIRKSDGEFRIADPFGNDFSLILEKSFSYLLEQDGNLDKWYKGWNERSINLEPNKQSETPKEPFETDANWAHYPKLMVNMRRKKNTQYRSIEQIHAALEWALFYSCIQRQYDAAVRELEYTDPADHSNLLKEAAEKTGLQPFDFLPVIKGKLVDFINDKADLVTVLSITLLIAANDPSHPLRKISGRYPDFIIQLFNIKKKRDEQGHGKGKAPKNQVELSEDAFMRNIVNALLPDVPFSDTPAAAVDDDFNADKTHNSRVNILSEFGFKKYNLLGADLQDKLIYAESLFLLCGVKDKKDDANAIYDAKDFVFFLCAVLQAIFRRKLAGTLPPDINNSEFIECAQTKAKKAGLREMPDSLRFLRPWKIRQTLQGNDKTLGSCVVAFLLMSDEETLKIISQIQPSFISDVADIPEKRGHGNEPLPMKKNELEKLRKSAYKTIETLLEV